MTTTTTDLVPLEERCAWRAADVGDSYVFELTDDHRAELDEALHHAEAATATATATAATATATGTTATGTTATGTTATGTTAGTGDVLDITRDDFPLPTLGPELRRIAGELIDGAGVVLIRGVPVGRYGKARASAIYWGIGQHLGRPWPQNAKGHLLGDVTDQGKAADDPTSRGNEIGGIAFPFHSDGSDLVGLFCLDAGASGGASLVANAVTIHNDLVADDPELAAALYDDLPYDLRGEQAPGARSWYLMPAFSRLGDRLFVRYIRPYVMSARRHADAPRPTPVQEAAMDRVDAMCADPAYRLSMQLEPGDMQFVNNYHVLHARDAYTDDRAAGKVRHLKRLWLETEVLDDDDKPERFRLGRTDGYWASKGRTKSELDI